MASSLLRALLLISLHLASAALVGSPAGYHQKATSQTSAPASQLEMIEHEMPLMRDPSQYEGLLRAAVADQGEIIRWYIGRVDEARGKAVAECVIMRSVDS